MNCRYGDIEYPLVSVVIPAYNAQSFIGETLQAVTSQTYKNIEILVVDDGSTDQTAEIVQSFARKDPRIILLQQDNAGVAAARNLAIEKSRGEYIAPIDADDIWFPQKIAKQVECILQAGDSCGLVYTWSVRIDEFGYITSKDRMDTLEGVVYPALAYCNFIGSASVPLIHSKCLEKVGYYNTQLKQHNAQGCEDWDLYFRIAEHYEYRVVREFLMAYRSTPQSMSLNFSSMLRSYFFVCQDIKDRHPEIPQRIFRWSEAQFYLHFARQSILAKEYINYLKWWFKSLLTDYSVLLNLGNYKMIVKAILGINKLSLQNKIKYKDINQQQIFMNIKKTNKFSIYQMINNYRWKIITQICQNPNTNN